MVFRNLTLKPFFVAIQAAARATGHWGFFLSCRLGRGLLRDSRMFLHGPERLESKAANSL